jgi:hypothetical protein
MKQNGNGCAPLSEQANECEQSRQAGSGMFKAFAPRKPSEGENSRKGVNKATASLALLDKVAAPPPELGNGAVRFLGEWAEASREAMRLGRPVFVLFQEVPGCATCTRFGAHVLSHDRLAALINEQFVACAVNNRGRSAGDRAALALFGEPMLNNPVVRLVDAAGRDLVPRAEGVYEPLALLARLEAALAAHQGRYRRALSTELLELELLAREPRAALDTATFSMGCYWQGERVLGAVPGVVSTKPGWSQGREVVRVVFLERPDVLRSLFTRASTASFSVVPHSEAQLEAARETGLAALTLTPLHNSTLTAVPSSEEKYFLRRSHFAKLLPTLSQPQQARLNAAIGERDEAHALLFLDATQRAALHAVRAS